MLRLAIQLGNLGVELGQSLEQDNREQNPDDADGDKESASDNEDGGGDEFRHGGYGSALRNISH